MKLIIHDLDNDKISNLVNESHNVVIISNDSSVKTCIGCFGCWVKTPGACVIKDQYCNMGELLSKCTELVIISKCFYGGFSPFVKSILDRSISYMLPNFEMRHKEMHHKRRYTNVINFTVHFYGENISSKEKDTAFKLVHANAINLDGKVNKIDFVDRIDTIGGII